MNLIINRQITIKKLQEEFNFHYPHLKVEFFKKNKISSRHPSKGDRIDPNIVIAEITERHQAVSINIEGDRTVTEFENDVKDQLGISAQVFRKSGNSWIETSLTDGWTLKKQNDEGALFSNSVEKKNLEQRLEEESEDVE